MKIFLYIFTLLYTIYTIHTDRNNTNHYLHTNIHVYEGSVISYIFTVGHCEEDGFTLSKGKENTG